jgi:hypothetical protein
MAYIVVTVSFLCPFCQSIGAEHIVAETDGFDAQEMSRILSRQPFECQVCLQTLPDGTFAKAHAELATPSRLKELHFTASRRPN